MSIFQYDDYKKFIVELLLDMPRSGYGQFKKIAEHLGVNSVVITQIFKGDRELSAENALELCAYFGFSDLESRYFLALVSLGRAGTHKLKQYYKSELVELRLKSKDLKNRVPQDSSLSDEARAMFYSNWYYSAIRLTSSIDGKNNVDEIAEYLGIPRSVVKQASDFLLKHGLMAEKAGALRMGPKLTHLESSSPLITRHHANWRLRSMQTSSSLGPDDLSYTSPMALSLETRREVREEITKLIASVLKRVQTDDSECVACLNIDWFDYSARRS